MALTKTGAVIASIGYFIVFGTLLGLSGIGGVSIEIPAGVSSEDGAVQQSFVAATVECIFSLFSDCSQTTVTKTFSAITNALSFLSSYLSFFFQLLTFQIPEIPTWLNSIVVIPPAVALMYVGISLFAGGGD